MIATETPWTREQIFDHLKVTFDAAVDRRPDLFEAYLIRLDGEDSEAQIGIMREALQATFNMRFPSLLTRRAIETQLALPL